MTDQQLKAALLKEFGDNVRRLRIAKELTQEALAEKVGISTRNMQKVEAGQLRLSILTSVKLRRTLKCKWDALMPK